jgi:hypothetical protein
MKLDKSKKYRFSGHVYRFSGWLWEPYSCGLAWCEVCDLALHDVEFQGYADDGLVEDAEVLK